MAPAERLETPTLGFVARGLMIHGISPLLNSSECTVRNYPLLRGPPTLVGTDHGFSFPMQYFEKHGFQKQNEHNGKNKEF